MGAAVGVALTGLLACAPFSRWPRAAPGGLEGEVRSRGSGRPLAGALVLLRIPPRRFAELRTDAAGRFALDGSGLRVDGAGGVADRLELVTAYAAGHRCAPSRILESNERLRLELEPAGLRAQRASCPAPPPAAGIRYASVFALLEQAAGSGSGAGSGRSPARVVEEALDPRTLFGFGGNCRGPVLGFAVEPGARRLAYQEAAGPGIAIRLLRLGARDASAFEPLAYASRVPPRRLAWREDGSLWLEAAAAWTGTTGDRRLLPALASGGGRVDASPASTRVAKGAGDEAHRAPRPELPGQACVMVDTERFAPAGQVGAGRRIELRFVGGGCHLVERDPARGSLARLDRAEGRARCRDARRVSAAQLRRALPGYWRRLKVLLETLPAPPREGFALRVEPDGQVFLEARDWLGGERVLEAPSFPVKTPLRRIEVERAARPPDASSAAVRVRKSAAVGRGS